MPSLDRSFDQFVARLTGATAIGSNATDPIYYFVFDPQEAVEVKRWIPIWQARLRNEGHPVIRVSFAELIWELIEQSGRWEEWLQMEPDFDVEEVNAAVHDVLTGPNGLVERVADVIAKAPSNGVVFLTEVESLHPYFRIRALEGRLHDRVRVPVVVFYPGRRAGQHGLHFLDLYPEDANYRATVIGGLP